MPSNLIPRSGIRSADTQKNGETASDTGIDWKIPPQKLGPVCELIKLTNLHTAIMNVCVCQKLWNIMLTPKNATDFAFAVNFSKS